MSLKLFDVAFALRARRLLQYLFYTTVVTHVPEAVRCCICSEAEATTDYFTLHNSGDTCPWCCLMLH